MNEQAHAARSRTAYDVIVVGGGIVGLATAREILLLYPHLKLALLEKEPQIVAHQSGHNSGVIHSGIYYKPGSLKAKACVEGHRAMIAFCEENSIPFRLCGKVIVALDESELPRLHDLYQRGITNGVQGLELIDPPRLRELEPQVAGVKAIYSPNTGVIDYKLVAHAYAAAVQASGGEILTSTPVLSLKADGQGTVVVTPQGDLSARTVITCAGLYSDKISGADGNFKIVPFRGSYYRLRPEKRDYVRALIYPVPDPSFPFLGVHFTRTMSDDVWVGPNAVLAFAREGYRRGDIKPSELLDALRYPGFRKLARRYWRTGLAEMYRDFVKSAYVKTAQQFIPALQAGDFVAGPSGVRAQALDQTGNLVDDFQIKQGANVIHVQNAPSPAATSSLVIARMIVAEAERAFSLGTSHP